MPSELDEEAWRRRSAKRQSYTSQMTCGTIQILTNPRTCTADPETATGPFSQISSKFTTEQRASRPTRRKHPEPDHDVYSDLHWDINPLDPRNWRKRKKHAHTLVAALVTFTVTLASSIIAPASSFLTSAYDTTTLTATLPVSLFLLGLAFGPFLSSSCSAVFSWRIIYRVSVLLFAILSLLSALVTTLPGLLISRLFAGILAGPALTQGSAMIAEMWKPEDRTAPLMFYFVAPLLGPVVGMVVGGYVPWSERDNWTRTAGLVLSLQSGYVFGTLYASFVALPGVFGAAYGLGISSQSLVFMSMVAGLALGYVALVLHHRFVYGPRAKHWQAQRASETEKGRRVSIQGTQRGTTDNFSPTNVSPLVSNDSSTTLALSQRGSRPASERMKTAPAVDHARNACLAAAAAHYLHSVGVNHDIEIQPEQTSLLLSTNPAYSDLCAALESHHLQFNAVQPAKVLVEALPARQTSEGPTTPQRAALVRPKSSHFFAAAVRSDEAATRLAPPSASRHVAFYVSTTDPQTQSATSTGPTEQHLHPALPASILLVASLFLIGWTTREDIHWIVPCIGMALLAFAALLTFVSIELHTADRFGESESASAGDGVLVVRYLMCAGFTMAAVPIYECLGVRWVTSMFGFMGVVVGVCPWVLVFAGGGRRDDGS
ncbi:hypothetical protein LTR57_020792 [Friedmanniomyces endolithicus]|nr:hypothetical protein LTR35_006835 [Friedmanniomyces endolithicus]KAK0296001.1 hypothetical protein LTS00_005286 [Friedmanniomyces endolithicus]KAK0900036.1 hypothetical protein LTR57_020792 [Friedmanniomyces endolithicus]KAK0970518.1 hypothetical protein LTS01_015756 [Friedmanniomyces endolithicus]